MSGYPVDPNTVIGVKTMAGLETATLRVMREHNYELYTNPVTREFGEFFTTLLLDEHKRRLEIEGKTWDGNYEFTTDLVIQHAQKAGLNAGVLEAIRRGRYPPELLTEELKEKIRLSFI